ncbi:MAG: tRNA (adenosine(37)-N6)-threonylcarbamoyltransferase complex ATPase subunit type 1 TsaE [Treponema sp.]|nr:tRNA (adenosine(37)-N6)-threonylcarbamoyltransferase complex ATPase subunit type 1 TsaE [Treponema sp.]
MNSADDTEALGERIGALAPGGTVVALRGDLGAGKTTFAKGVARGLGVDDEVTSPTFTVVSEYSGRLRLHHIDAYRLSGGEDFASVGGEELFADPDGLCLVEWSERIAEALPPDAVSVELTVRPDGSRDLRLQGAALEELLR